MYRHLHPVVHNYNHALALSWYSSEMSPEEQRMRAGARSPNNKCLCVKRVWPLRRRVNLTSVLRIGITDHAPILMRQNVHTDNMKLSCCMLRHKLQTILCWSQQNPLQNVEMNIEVLSQYCRVYTKTEKTSGFSKKCVVSHFCKNHKGSASNMETVGAYRIFERSETNRSLRYTSYYGDGASKAFKNVKDIYGYDSVVKYECIGHVQKRVGSRSRKLKKCTKGLGGKGKLTDKFIDTLQNYFGITIRSNVGNLSNMQTAVIAAFFHCCSTDKKPMHGQCPSGSDTWCKYQKGQSRRKTV
ncbi:uncharacterized protein TNCV_19161 [Trichonephila clavipes]|nr:uncharacterized protein TNCV_19161 [Trichonephila clavipes]